MATCELDFGCEVDVAEKIGDELMDQFGGHLCGSQVAPTANLKDELQHVRWVLLRLLGKIDLMEERFDALAMQDDFVELQIKAPTNGFSEELKSLHRKLRDQRWATLFGNDDEFSEANEQTAKDEPTFADNDPDSDAADTPQPKSDQPSPLAAHWNDAAYRLPSMAYVSVVEQRWKEKWGKQDMIALDLPVPLLLEIKRDLAAAGDPLTMAGVLEHLLDSEVYDPVHWTRKSGPQIHAALAKDWLLFCRIWGAEIEADLRKEHLAQMDREIPTGPKIPIATADEAISEIESNSPSLVAQEPLVGAAESPKMGMDGAMNQPVSVLKALPEGTLAKLTEKFKTAGEVGEAVITRTLGQIKGIGPKMVDRIVKELRRVGIETRGDVETTAGETLVSSPAEGRSKVDPSTSPPAAPASTAKPSDLEGCRKRGYDVGRKGLPNQNHYKAESAYHAAWNEGWQHGAFDRAANGEGVGSKPGDAPDGSELDGTPDLASGAVDLGAIAGAASESMDKLPDLPPYAPDEDPRDISAEEYATYKAGCEAALDGQRQTTNPHQMGSRLWYRWDKGWQDTDQQEEAEIEGAIVGPPTTTTNVPKELASEWIKESAADHVDEWGDV